MARDASPGSKADRQVYLVRRVTRFPAQPFHFGGLADESERIAQGGIQSRVIVPPMSAFQIFFRQSPEEYFRLCLHNFTLLDLQLIRLRLKNAVAAHHANKPE